MKKILLMAATLLFAVSCSDWEGSITEPKQAKIVDAIVFADGSSVHFTYDGPNNMVSRVEYSSGKRLEVGYDGLNTANPVIAVRDGESLQEWRISNGMVHSIAEDGATVATMSYDTYNSHNAVYYLTFLSNSASCSRTEIEWLAEAVPYEKKTSWYADNSFNIGSLLTRQLVRPAWSSVGSPTNWLTNIDLMPFVVPEFVDGFGIDPAVVSSVSLYCFRPYNLPSAATIAYSHFNAVDGEETPDPSSEYRRYIYDRDDDGYINGVYTIAADTESRELLFTVLYRTYSGQ